MEALWHGFAAGMALPSYADMASSAGPIEWVSFVISTSEKSERRNKLGLLVAFGWHIWKERNRRIFDNKELYVPRLFGQA
jgi:hypothetical protein